MTVYTKSYKKSENRKVYKKDSESKETIGIVSAIIVFLAWVGLMFFMFENLIFAD